MPNAHRAILCALACAFCLAAPVSAQTAPVPAPGTAANAPYGLIGKLRAKPGQRDALIAILAEGTAAMPGCLSYVIARDKGDADALWITETWDSAASHRASLALPAVRAAIARGKPLIAGFGERFETEPVIAPGLRPAP